MKRIESIDNLRGVAIFLVILGHILITRAPGRGTYPLCEIIYSFHMSLFFFISGFLAFKTNRIEENGIKQYVIKKTKQLLIPYLFWLLLAPIFMYNIYPSSYKELLLKFNFIPNLNYWFLPLLYIFFMLYLLYLRGYNSILKKKSYDENMFVSLIIIFFSIIGLLLKEYYMVVYSIYFASFLLGHLISKNEELEKLISKKTIFTVSVIILCVLWKIFPIATNGNMYYSLLNLLYLAISSITAIIVLFNIFRNQQLPQLVSKFLCEIGKNTMALYLLPIWLLPKDFYWDDNDTYTLINLEACTIAVLHSLVALIVAKIVNLVPFLGLLLFGKKS